MQLSDPGKGAIVYSTVLKCFKVAAILAPLFVLESFQPLLADEIIQQKHLRIAINTENNELEHFAFALTDTLAILIDDSEYWTRVGDPNAINLLFASGKDFITNKRVSRRAAAIFDDHLAQQITAEPTNADSCFVVPITVSKDHQLLLAVHNSDPDDTKSEHKCLVLSLVIFFDVGVERFEPNSWRNTIAKIFEHLKL